MKWAMIISFFAISFNLWAAPNFDQDLRLLKEAARVYPSLIQNFKTDILPLSQKTKQNPQYLLTIAENDKLQEFWRSFHDMRMVLGVLKSTYKDEPETAPGSFIKYLSSIMLLNSGAELVTAVWNNDLMRKRLDITSSREVPQGTFHSLENEIFKSIKTDEKEASVADVPTYLEIEPLEDLAQEYVSFENEKAAMPASAAELFSFLEEQKTRREFFRPFLESFKNRLTLKTRNLSYAFNGIYYKIFTKISTWIGDAKVYRRNPELHYGDTYIKKDLAKSFLDKLEPGDLVISRGNWFLSNAFLPGFWPHSTIYLGESSKLKNSLDGDLEVQNYFTQKCFKEALPCFNLSTYLELSQKTKKAWANYLTRDEHGEDRVLIEATSDGVILSTVYAYMADFLAGMRPQVSKLEKAKAILQAFTKFGLEYDFDFDLRQEDRLVCSALLDKSYRSEPSLGKRGIHFEKYYAQTLGRPNLPPTNLVVKTYDERLGVNQELKFAAFLKGDKKTNSALFVSEDVFYASRLWPKWSFMQE